MLQPGINPGITRGSFRKTKRWKIKRLVWFHWTFSIKLSFHCSWIRFLPRRHFVCGSKTSLTSNQIRLRDAAEDLPTTHSLTLKSFFGLVRWEV